MADNWEPCPRCGSKRVKPKPRGRTQFICGGIGILLTPILGITILLVGLGLLTAGILAYFADKNELKCSDCGLTWKHGEKEIKTEA